MYLFYLHMQFEPSRIYAKTIHFAFSDTYHQKLKKKKEDRYLNSHLSTKPAYTLQIQADNTSKVVYQFFRHIQYYFISFYAIVYLPNNNSLGILKLFDNNCISNIYNTIIITTIQRYLHNNVI